MTHYLFKENIWSVFIVTILLMAGGIFVQNHLLITDSLYYNSYSEQLSIERIDQLLSFSKKWEWIQYTAIPILILFQSFLISLLILCGSLMLDSKFSFKAVWGISLRSILWLAIARIGISLIIYFIFPLDKMEDLVKANFYSILYFMDTKAIPIYLFYPLYKVNLVELIYILIIASGIGYLSGWKFRKALVFTSGTYGVGLVIWILFIVFLQLNYS